MTCAKQQTQQLEAAFNAFNQASTTLVAQYAELEERAELLTEQLAEANNERQKQLAEKEKLADRLASIIDALPGGLIVIGGNGKLIKWNSKAAELLGTELHDKSWFDIKKSCLSKGSVHAGEVTLTNGCCMSISMQDLKTENEKIILLSDVTHSRSLQNSLKHKERLTAVGEMMGKLAHQIRTPLASAFLHLSNYRRSQMNGSGQVGLQKLHFCLNNMQHIIDDLLLFIRGENPAMDLVKIGDIYKNIMSSAKIKLEEDGVSLSIISDINEQEILINHSAIEGAILNLLDNAAQSQAKHVSLIFSKNIDSIEIIVEDDGFGISPEKYTDIFSPFFTTRSNGTGLGLAVVANVIELHAGSIEIDPDYVKGARFKIKIPINAAANINFVRSESTNLHQLYN